MVRYKLWYTIFFAGSDVVEFLHRVFISSGYHESAHKTIGSSKILRKLQMGEGDWNSYWFAASPAPVRTTRIQGHGVELVFLASQWWILMYHLQARSVLIPTTIPMFRNQFNLATVNLVMFRNHCCTRLPVARKRKQRSEFSVPVCHGW